MGTLWRTFQGDTPTEAWLQSSWGDWAGPLSKPPSAVSHLAPSRPPRSTARGAGCTLGRVSLVSREVGFL